MDGDPITPLVDGTNTPTVNLKTVKIRVTYSTDQDPETKVTDLDAQLMKDDEEIVSTAACYITDDWWEDLTVEKVYIMKTEVYNPITDETLTRQEFAPALEVPNEAIVIEAQLPQLFSDDDTNRLCI